MCVLSDTQQVMEVEEGQVGGVVVYLCEVVMSVVMIGICPTWSRYLDANSPHAIDKIKHLQLF